MTRNYFTERGIVHTLLTAGLLAAGLMAGAAQAGLPPPTPAAQQAAAAKKAADAAQAAKDKESLAASMDAVTARWRSRAAQQGWKTHPAVAIAAAPAPAAAAGAAPAAGAAGTAPAAGPGSATGAASGAGGTSTGAAPTGQPAGQLTQAAASLPIRSEKLGTAPPSADVKKAPTQAQPRNATPTVQKGVPTDVSKK